MNPAADLMVKHIVAQQSKAFFGYGPKGWVGVALQGRVAVFAGDLQGPALMAALAADPFGRLAMRRINDLYAQSTAGALRQLAAERFGLSLDIVAGDLDFAAGLSLGVAVADRALPGAPPDDRAPAHLAGAVAEVLGAPAEVRLGPALLVARAAVPASPVVPPGDASGVFAQLAAWDGFRSSLGERLLAAGAAAGLVPRGTFAARCDGGLVAGLLLR